MSQSGFDMSEMVAAFSARSNVSMGISIPVSLDA